jgi:hypothetical protein
VEPESAGSRGREIVGVDWRSPDQQVRAFREGEGFRSRTRLTGDTARLVGEILERGNH